MLTRRIRVRELLLLPSKRTNLVICYVLAAMCKKWNVRVHALIVMGNHWHVVLTDQDGKIVEFQRDCHSFIARGLNAYHGEFESIWATEASSRVECEDAEDIIGKMVYTMANPVEAGLVRNGHSWPGIRRRWPCKPLVIKKPAKFFRSKDQGGSWPDEVVLEFTRPPGYEELADEDLAAVIKGAIDQREMSVQKQRDTDKRPFLGRRRVLEQSRHDKPRTQESRFGISPRVACRDKWRRIERLASNKRWLNDYRTSLTRWCAGERDVEFPVGTYKMRVIHGVNCARAPD